MDGCRPQIHGQPERARIRPYVHPFPFFGRRRRQLNNHTRNGGMAEGQPPAAAHGLRAEDGAIRVARLGVPSRNRTRHAPQRPSPEHSAGGDSSPDSQIVWASVCPASTGRMWLRPG